VRGRRGERRRRLASLALGPQVTQRHERTHRWDAVEVVRRWRRACGPLERIAFPRVVPSDLTATPAANQVAEGDQDGERDEERGKRYEGVRHSPALLAEAAWVGGDAPGHPFQPEGVHDQEGGVEADEHGPEVPLAQCLAELAPGYLREPVIDAGENR